MNKRSNPIPTQRSSRLGRSVNLTCLEEEFSTNKRYSVSGVEIGKDCFWFNNQQSEQKLKPKTIHEMMSYYCDKTESDQIILDFYPYKIKHGAHNLPKHIAEMIDPDNVFQYNGYFYFRHMEDAVLLKISK